ncbi:MAG TPA: LuxR C-terminal-related transcriptional regulator [Streptosporangiaceae bacterium]|nr:LuxR C-terminal-related transcriptional regulator [Streptosporangiaceae bacterium]
MFDVLVGKLRIPPTRPGSVHRTSLIERLAGEVSCPVVSVVAPAGYGKTTLLAQWAERSRQAVAWVSVDELDNDPKVLLTYVAEALNAVEPVGERVFDALASPASSVPGSVVPRLGSAFASMISPVVLMLDDVHLLHNAECRAALSVLADHVPGGSQLVLAGRTEPPVRIARLRAEGRLAEIGPRDLSLTAQEAASLLRAAEVVLDDEDVAELHGRTEGWAVGLYLAALYLREGGSPRGAAASFGGDDRFVSEYVESEFLARISSSQRAFLTRTAVLERMCGPLCEAVLGAPGSAAALTDLARSNLLLVPLDHRREWYRYHHLFRDLLLAELERREPGLAPALRRRAAAWYLEHDLPEKALEYSILAGDVDSVARLVQTLWRPVYIRGRTATLQRWFSWLDDRGGIEGRPLVAMNAAFLAEMTGHPVQAERWADAVDRWQQDARPPFDAYTEAMAATLRAILCRRGVQQMRADADEAARKFAAASFVPGVTPLLQGVARVLCGDLDEGDMFFSDALSLEEERGAPDIMAVTLCQRSLAAMARNQWDQAEDFAGRAHAHLRQAGIEDSYGAALTSAVRARTALHRGDVQAARRELIKVQRLRPLMTYAQPHWAVQLRIALIRVDLALNDLGGARILMREIDEILKRRPDLGTLVGEARELRSRLAAERTPGTAGASTLTAAELRLLPMLSTHLQMHEIAAEMYLSPHTVRAQGKSVYRKLGAASRSQAVARARELGLLEG